MVGNPKFVDNYLNAIYSECKTVDNMSLQEIQMNVRCRYQGGKYRYGNQYYMNPLDEFQESIHLWNKNILLSPDEMSWRLCSPNVACAHMRINHEKIGHVKGSLDYSSLTNLKSKHLHCSTKTTHPSNELKKEDALMVLIVFSQSIPNQSCVVEDGYNTMKKLKTKLSKTTANDADDELETCINKMFGKYEESNNDDIATIEVIKDDHNGFNPLINDEEKTQMNLLQETLT